MNGYIAKALCNGAKQLSPTKNPKQTNKQAKQKKTQNQ